MAKKVVSMPIGKPVVGNEYEQESDDSVQTAVDLGKSSISAEVYEKPTPKYTVQEVHFSVPRVDVEEGYSRSRFDLRLPTREAYTLRSLTWGLEHEGAKLRDGTEIKNQIHVIRWLLEQVELDDSANTGRSDHNSAGER